jgi:hypothetical protein
MNTDTMKPSIYFPTDFTNIIPKFQGIRTCSSSNKIIILMVLSGNKMGLDLSDMILERLFIQKIEK